MTSYYTIKNSLRKIETAPSHEEQLYRLLEVYMEVFPVKNSYLFRYSPLGYLAEGIISLLPSGLVHIRDIRDDIRSLPIIYSAIRERQAKYTDGMEYFKSLSSKYIISSSVNSMLVVPISFNSVVIAYLLSSEFNQEFSSSEYDLSLYTYFGLEIGKLIQSFHTIEENVVLSKREMEVMRRISWGESTKIMADSMGISELTVKQYVKTAISKLNAQNRTQAVAELFRRGVLS